MNVLLVGDSQALGLSLALGRQLSAAGHRLVATVAENGISSSALADQLASFSTPNYDVALVVLGGNDTVSSSLPTAIAEVRSQLRGSVVWIGPMHTLDPVVGPRHAAVGQVQANLAGQMGYRWIDGAQISADLPHAGDGVHFTAAAYDVLASRALGLLNASNSPLVGIGIGLSLAAAIGLVWWMWK